MSIQSQNLEDISKDLNFKHFTSSDGLSQRSVMSILQDKKGYLWFGTRDGLNKFDGHQFVVYKHHIEDSTSISNNNIHSIFEDNHGNLWIGTQNGLNKYNPKQDNFVHYKHSSDENTAEDNIIWEMTQIKDSLLWVATNNGILQINLLTDEIQRIQKERKGLNFMGNTNIRSFLKTEDGTIWICNTRNIAVYHPEKGTYKRIDYPKKQKNDIHLNRPPILFVDQQNTIWLGYEEGLARYSMETNSFEDFKFQQTKPITDAVRSICQDVKGNLWIGTYSGLYILDHNHTHLKHIAHDKNNSTSLSQNSIYSIIRDSRGDMWIGTWAGGINYYNKDNGAFKNIFSGNTDNKLNYKVVSGIAEDEDGNLWIGTEGGGVNYYNRKKQKFTYFKNNPAKANSLSADNVKSIIIDQNDQIWIGIHDGGLNLLNPKIKPYKFESINFPKSSGSSLKGFKVLTLFEDRKGNIWIGTLTGGLIHYNVQTKQLSRLDDEIKTIMSIAETDDPNLLLIGGNNGLETINTTTKERKKIPVTSNGKRSQPLFVNCIFVDKSNNYWIGTEGQGLHRYNPETKKTTFYGLKEGLPNDIIYGILPDDNRNLWISTNKGISQLNIGSNSIKNYYQSDGLQGNEFNYGSFFKSSKDELFFGGTNGLTYFNPNHIRKNTFVPNVDIYNIEVNNTPYARITDSISKITLKHNENNFNIDFTTLSYMQPDKNQFAYILEGVDQQWNEVGNRRKAIYTNISAGTYTFKVKGSNNDDIWNEQGDTIQIEVLPAPWHTWWAYALYLTTCFGISLYIGKLISLRIKERKEKERLEAINQLKLRLFTDVSHDFRTPLTLILGPLEKMLQEKETDQNTRKQHEIMYRNARMLLQLVNQILDFRKSESKSFTLQASQSNIIPFVENIKKSFDGLAEKKNINYQLNTNNDHIDVWFDKIKLKKILFNLLSNAFKFTKDNNKIIINISTTRKKQKSKPGDSNKVDYLKIDVINFGTVIPKNQLKFVFDRFYQIDQNKNTMGSGIGLALTKRLIKLHKGRITVKSSQNKGTRFSLYLRLGSDHLTENQRIDESEDTQEIEFYVDMDPISTDYTKPAKETKGHKRKTEIEIETEIKKEKTPIEPQEPTTRNELPRLLIVEDSIDVQNFISDIFRAKYTIFLAENGKQAISIAQENPIDLIISDVSMPVMDGFELCHTIKTTLTTSHIPVILLTAKTSPTHQEKGFDTGADAYITKPFNANILETRVNNLLQTRRNLIRKFKKDIILEPKKLEITSADEIFLKKAIALVEENITNQNFNTGTFIDHMNMSRTVIYTKIKALTGQNISTFIRTIRLKKASIMITQTNMNISQIAYEVGFNDLKYFRKCFKDFFKLNPSEYKRKYSNRK